MRAKTVAIVGAGVVGLCTALEAQRKGYKVTLVDKGAPGLGASFGNAGYLATELIDPLSTPKTLRSALPMWANPYGPLSLPLAYIPRIIPWLMRFIRAARPAAVESGRSALQQLNQAAVPAWKRCLADIQAGEQLVHSGYLLVWESPEKLEEARQHAAYLSQWGVRSELVDGERLAQLEPELAENISHALFFPEACRVRDPYQLCGILFSAFQARGGTFVQQAVDALLPDTKGITLQTSTARLAFDYAVVCAGAWSKSLLESVGLHIPLEAERGYQLTFNAPHVTLNHPIGSAERRFVMTPLDSSLRVVGITELGGLKLKPFKRRFAALYHHCRKLLGGLNDPFVQVSEWMGHRPTLPDSLPVIDRHPRHPQLLFAFGNQHLGLTQAAVSAELVVSRLTGKNPTAIDAAPFSVDRF
ncbi:NAD(P)/FAD-dependent oxidoreductase [Microbulbifer sp.]|uniref:NAD(P)/FAD-dependent oxidoreductase n=1 Tax=Microbulbifer sp. TaxID=1908541 RepID=UPI003F3BBFDE